MPLSIVSGICASAAVLVGLFVYTNLHAGICRAYLQFSTWVLGCGGVALLLTSVLLRPGWSPQEAAGQQLDYHVSAVLLLVAVAADALLFVHHRLEPPRA